MKNLILFTFIMLFYLCKLDAQTDTSLLLPTAIISSSPIRDMPVGEQFTRWDSSQVSANNTQNIAELIASKSGLFIKNYGGGSLATTSLRGGSAGHTAVTWNGFVLQSPMLGQLDFSLLPSVFVDEIDLHYGGNSSLWGSGAIGGVIALKNTVPKSKGFQINLQSTFGSFGLWNEQLKFQFGKEKLKLRTRLFHQEAKNDFPYFIRPDLPKRQQSHAAIEQNGLLQEIHWQMKANQQISAYIWYQHSDRQIPPTTVQNESLAEQKDESLRTTVHWKYFGQKSILQSRLGFFSESLDYQDVASGLQSLSQFSTFIGEIEGQWFLNEKQKFFAGINETYTQADTKAYQDTPAENRLAVFAAFYQQLGKFQFQLNGRQALIGNKFIPFVPSFGMEVQINKCLAFKSKITRNYRLPTFNDRFWLPGGNPDLKAESGWSQEVSLVGKWLKNKSKFNYSATFFSRKINNWILWSKKENQIFWSANNITKVWSRGIEQRFSYHFPIAEFEQQLSGGHDYVLSTNEQALQFPNIKAGDQLFYVPKHQFFGSYQLNWKDFEMSYQHRFTGSVTALTTSLESYQLGNFRFQYLLKRKKINSRFFFHINNVWNESYRVIERRAMPGRNYVFGFRLLST